MKNKLLAVLGLLAFFGLIAAYVSEFQWFNRTFEGGGLALRSAIFGLAAGLTAGWLLSKKTKDAVATLQIWSACIIGGLVLAPLLGSLSNRLFAGPEQPVRVEFMEEKPFFAGLGRLQGEVPKPTGWYVFIQHEGQLRRLKGAQQSFPEAKRGDSVEVLMKKGFWKFEVARLKEKWPSED